MRGVFGGAVDGLGLGFVGGGGGGHDVFYVGLGVAVVEGEPAGLDLDHDFVALEEGVVGSVEPVLELGGFGGFEGGGVFEGVDITASEDLLGDHELVAGHFLSGTASSG